jgi:VIT1/CCC1 family predicted Fe2+/Mn2+ transporter
VYDELIDSELLKKAQELSTYFKTNFDDESQNILFNVETYNGLLINLTNVFELYLKYKKENVELFKKLQDETSDILTNDRKTYYQDQGIDNLKFIYHYVILTIYVIAVLCYVVFSFIYPSNLSMLLRIVILILMILLPFFSTLILGKIIEIIHNIYYLLPKNAHKQMQ